MQEIKVSVIIPVYNAEEWLETCIESVIRQTLKEIEIICIDDGSTDKSLSILKEFRDRDSRISIITQENAGAGAANNRGLEAARGEYIAFLDADDFFELEVLAKTYECSTKNAADICIFRFDRIDSQNRFFGDYGFDARLVPANRCFDCSDIEEGFFIITNPAVWNKLWRRTYIQEKNIFFQELPITCDMHFTYKALINANRIIALPEVLVHYRTGNPKALSGNRGKYWRYLYNVLVAIKEEIVNNNLHLEKDFTNHVAYQVLYLLDNINDIDDFRSCFNEIREHWIESLIEKYDDPEYFYDPKMYERFKAMLTMDMEGFIYYERKLNQKTIIELDIHEKLQAKRIRMLENELYCIEENIYKNISIKKHLKYYLNKKIRSRG